MSNSASCLRQDSISWRSDLEPRMTPTSGTYSPRWDGPRPCPHRLATPWRQLRRDSETSGLSTFDPRTNVPSASSHPDPPGRRSLDLNPKPPPVQCPSEKRLPEIVRAPLQTTPPFALDRHRRPFPRRSARGRRM